MLASSITATPATKPITGTAQLTPKRSNTALIMIAVTSAQALSATPSHPIP